MVIILVIDQCLSSDWPVTSALADAEPVLYIVCRATIRDLDFP